MQVFACYCDDIKDYLLGNVKMTLQHHVNCVLSVVSNWILERLQINNLHISCTGGLLFALIFAF